MLKDIGDRGEGVRHVDGEAFDRVVVHGREQRLPVRRVDLVGRLGLELVHVKGADGEGDLGWVRALVLVVDDEIDQRAVLVLELGQCLGDLRWEGGTK